MHSIPKADAWCNDADSDGAITLHLPDASAKRERIRNLKERLLGEHQEAAESVVKLDSKDSVDPSSTIIADAAADASAPAVPSILLGSATAGILRSSPSSSLVIICFVIVASIAAVVFCRHLHIDVHTITSQSCCSDPPPVVEEKWFTCTAAMKLRRPMSYRQFR